MGLSGTSPDVLLAMLQQRHVELVDADGTPHLTDPAVVDTVCWYARAAAGPDRIGTDTNPAPGGAAADLAPGDVAALVLADWAVADLERSAPSLAGQLAMVPLPRFGPADARTASWGGTMAGIPRFCPRPRPGVAADRVGLPDRPRRAGTARPASSRRCRPPGPTRPSTGPTRSSPGSRSPSCTSGWRPSCRPRHVTPYTTTAQNLLAFVLNRAVSRVRSGAADDLEPPSADGWPTGRRSCSG